MKALTVLQPFAHLIIIGEKRAESRRWYTPYRGPLLIHAGKSRSWLEPGDEDRNPGMAFGAIVGKCELLDCRKFEDDDEDWEWVLCDVQRFATPIPYRGKRGLFDIPDDVVAEAMA